MGSQIKVCAICAWRLNCQKKYSVSMDASGNVHCSDYSRDLAIKDKDVNTAIEKYEG